MTAPTSSPRGEHAGRPGANWETELRYVEVVVDQDDGESPFGWRDPEPQPRPNRATRRALKRGGRKTP